MDVDDHEAKLLCSSGYFLKSPLDPREFRVIELCNGLRVILCSTFKNEAKTDGEKIWEDNGEYEKIDEFNRIVGGGKNRCPEMMSTSGTPSESDMAYGAIAVNVGSYSSPQNISGLAHLCEHALLLGSEKYPVADEILYLHREIGGSCNASTSLNRTCFFFSCSQSNFLEYLDRFSDFMASPKMDSEALHKETHIIQCEYLWRKNSDGIREYAFLNCLANDTPQTNFTCGTNKTLALEDLHACLTAWKRDYYNPQNTTLTLSGPYSLNCLESLSKRYFSKLRSEGAGRNAVEELEQFKNPFENSPNFSGMIYWLVPFLDVKKLIVSWGFNVKAGNNYSTNPGDLICHLLNISGEGGLKHYLYQNGLALNVSAQLYVRTEICSTLNIQIDLTDDGLEEVKDVIGYLFSYIEFMKEINHFGGPLARYFCHFKKIQYQTFHYKTFESSADESQSLAEASKDIPVRELLTYSLPKNYNRDLIAAMLRELAPERVNILIEDKELSKLCDQNFEKYFYSVDFIKKKIDPFWLDNWNNPERITKFQLPRIENFLISDIYSPYGTKEVDYGTLTFKNKEKGCIKVEKYKFKAGKIPEAIWTFKVSSGIFQNPEGIVDRKMLCIQELWIDMLNDEVAGLNDNGIFSRNELKLSVGLDGSFDISINGTCYKLEFYFKQIFQAFIRDGVCLLTEKNKFENRKTEKIRSTLNEWKDAKTYGDDVLSKVIIHNHICKSEYADILSEITYFDFLDHARAFVSDMFVYGEMKGVVPFFHVKNILIYLEKFEFRSENLYTTINPEATYTIHTGEKVIPLSALEETDNTSVIVNYYQMDKFSSDDEELVKKLCKDISRFLPMTLRVKEQLAYKVFANHQNDYGVSSIIIYLIANPDRFSMKYINWRLENFLRHYFEDARNNPRKSYIENPRILKLFHDYLLSSGSHYKKVSVQVTGHKTDKDKNPKDFSGIPPPPPQDPNYPLYIPGNMAARDNFGIGIAFGETPPTHENHHFITNIAKLHSQMNIFQ